MCYYYFIMNKNHSVKKRFSMLVFGQVQGVCFRYEAQDLAKKLQITGFTKNMPDGIVKIVAEGEEENIEEFKKWCYRGPSAAKVKKIELLEEKTTNKFNAFEIKY